MGGMEEHVRMLAEQLDHTRLDVYAVVPDNEPTAPFTESMRTAAEHVELITPDRRRGIRNEVREAFRLARFARAEQIDVAHLHSTTYGGQTLAAAALKAGGVRTIYVTEHLAPDAYLRQPARLVRNVFSRLVSGIVCVSSKNYERRSRWITTPIERTVVVPNGIDIRRFGPIAANVVDDLRIRHNVPAGAPVVGTAVRFEPEKGLKDLVQAMAEIHVRHPDAILLMVGDGSLRGALEAQVDALGLREVTRFVGFTDDSRPYYAMMDVFVLPVPVGSASIGLLEAMAMGVPPVMTFGGKGEAVIHGETGFCAEPNNPASIAEYVNRLLDDDDERHRLGTAARAIVEDEFSSQRVAATLTELYVGGPSALPRPA